MKKNHFYSHIIEFQTIHIDLDNLNLEHDEKHELLDLAESAIHHAVLDTVLSELTEEDKRNFLKHMHEEDHSKVWKFLSEKIDDAEDKIVKTIRTLKKELHDDIKESKNRKKLHDVEHRNI